MKSRTKVLASLNEGVSPTTRGRGGATPVAAAPHLHRSPVLQQG
eukprot:CAMPEP_0194320172 /NCGR_PEP_ID=MMETSP0171-20130528/16547_1 /TAXON_ID=218684 /ORGANISM="Corethron pennatum, Strain L29A3" /LENGTH=43 /DNA_ID= /DNA_START= /DNA_END= /DNA_ORIENTATION=